MSVSLTRITALLLAVAMVVAACGGAEDEPAAGPALEPVVVDDDAAPSPDQELALADDEMTDADGEIDDPMGEPVDTGADTCTDDELTSHLSTADAQAQWSQADLDACGGFWELVCWDGQVFHYPADRWSHAELAATADEVMATFETECTFERGPSWADTFPALADTAPGTSGDESDAEAVQVDEGDEDLGQYLVSEGLRELWASDPDEVIELAESVCEDVVEISTWLEYEELGEELWEELVAEGYDDLFDGDPENFSIDLSTALIWSSCSDHLATLT